MWESLGFRESPYNANPLQSRAEDIDLLVGRDVEAIEFATTLDSSNNGILVISGLSGVGKTSFLNVQQYKLENELAPFGPKILSARHLCPLRPTDDLKTLAIRALDSLYKSVQEWCALNEKKVPSETQKIGKWLSGAGASGFDFGIDIMGFGGNIGRSVELSSLNDCSFEAVADAISAIASEVVARLGFRSAIVAIDNIENFSEEQLGAMLISYRDTLFSIPSLWWILIGRSGLGSQIQTIDPRVFERITGSGIEIRPVNFETLDEAIAFRVSKFHKSSNGNAPLTTDTHRRLFDSSFGEMRFVFKYSNSICLRFVQDMRHEIFRIRDKFKLTPRKDFSTELNSFIAEHLLNQQIRDKQATECLLEIVAAELEGLSLKPREKEILQLIGTIGVVHESDKKQFQIRTMQDFSTSGLVKLHRQNLLSREQDGRDVKYQLRGVARLSYDFGLLP